MSKIFIIIIPLLLGYMWEGRCRGEWTGGKRKSKRGQNRTREASTFCGYLIFLPSVPWDYSTVGRLIGHKAWPLFRAQNQSSNSFGYLTWLILKLLKVKVFCTSLQLYFLMNLRLKKTKQNKNTQHEPHTPLPVISTSTFKELFLRNPGQDKN